MALKTQGFALSTLPRAPQIPNNIGQIDVKEIYDGVRRGLESFEMARTAMPRMALADAEIAAKTAQAPLRTRGVLAETEAQEAQLPLNTAILAERASPERIALERQALLNRSTKQPAGAVQTAQALANARLRLQEDSTDLAAIELVKALERIAPNVQGAIDQRATAVTDNNAAKIVVGAGNNATQMAISSATLDSVEQRAAAANAMREDLAKRGFTQSEINARIGAQGRVDAMRAANVGRLYEGAMADNQRIQQSLASLSVIEDKIDAYRNSALGSGPIVGSDAGLLVRNIFGDRSGQELKAAVSQEMANAVQTIRGLGAMSDTEFKAVMDQLPRTNDVGGALDTKLAYMQALRPWLAARSNMYLSELEKGTSPITAHQKVREAFPMPGIAGTTPAQPQSPSVSNPNPAAAAPAAPRVFGTSEEAEAAGQRGEIQPNQVISVGGKQFKWTP